MAKEAVSWQLSVPMLGSTMLIPTGLSGGPGICPDLLQESSTCFPGSLPCLLPLTFIWYLLPLWSPQKSTGEQKSMECLPAFTLCSSTPKIGCNDAKMLAKFDHVHHYQYNT